MFSFTVKLKKIRNGVLQAVADLGVCCNFSISTFALLIKKNIPRNNVRNNFFFKNGYEFIFFEIYFPETFFKNLCFVIIFFLQKKFTRCVNLDYEGKKRLGTGFMITIQLGLHYFNIVQNWPYFSTAERFHHFEWWKLAGEESL